MAEVEEPRDEIMTSRSMRNRQELKVEGKADGCRQKAEGRRFDRSSVSRFAFGCFAFGRSGVRSLLHFIPEDKESFVDQRKLRWTKKVTRQKYFSLIFRYKAKG